MSRVQSINEVVKSDRGMEKIVDSQEFHTTQYQVSNDQQQQKPELIRDVQDDPGSRK